MANSAWSYPTGNYTVQVASVSGTGTINLTTSSTGTLNTTASYTPPGGTLANGGTLGPAGTATNVTWDGTNLGFTYNGFSYQSGLKQPSSTQTIFQGGVNLPSIGGVVKNWTATK